MKIKFCGGTQEGTTGACFLFKTTKSNFLLDCGMFQGGREVEEKNYDPFLFDPKEINFVILSHSHLDHIGRLPKLVKEGFTGKIYATPPTIDFTRLMLEDAQNLMREKAAKAGVIPLINSKDIEQIMNLFEPTEYGREVEAAPDVKFVFHNAGHILGSAITELRLQDEGEEKTVVYTGDLGNYPVPILQPPATLEKADYILIESTYGDRDHNHETRSGQEILEDAIEETVTRGGVLMIPSFALERTQQLLYELNHLVENKKVPAVPVYFDSPLAIRITRVYKNFEEYFDLRADALIKSGDDIFKFPNLYFTETTAQSKEINDIAPPKVIIAGSGMSQGGRIIHHEMRYLPDPKSTLLVVGYQAKGTLGRQIVDGAKTVRIADQDIEVRAKIIQMDSYSAHADQTELLRWLSLFKKPVKQVFAVHGEEAAAGALVVKIRDELGLPAKVPTFGQEVEI